jgi:hypothetical protein
MQVTEKMASLIEGGILQSQASILSAVICETSDDGLAVGISMIEEFLTDKNISRDEVIILNEISRVINLILQRRSNAEKITG